MKIWDLHCHLSGVPGDSPEERIGQIVEIAARMGIERLCVYMGMQWSKDPDPAKFRRENDEVLRAIAKYPKQTFGFVYLNPKHVEASLADGVIDTILRSDIATISGSGLSLMPDGVWRRSASDRWPTSSPSCSRRGEATLRLRDNRRARGRSLRTALFPRGR